MGPGRGLGPAAALAASPALLAYATRAAAATGALVAAYQRIDRAGTLLSRDRSEDAPRAGCVPANQLGTTAPLLDGLRQAAQAAGVALRNPRAAVPEPAVTAEVPVRDLRCWVRWLTGRYALEHREIPPCWYRHGPLVEELSALRTAHLSSYDPRAQPTAPADWHHTLAGTRARLHDWVARTGCRPAEHRQDKPQPWADAQPPAAYTAGLSGHIHAETGGPSLSGRTGP